MDYSRYEIIDPLYGEFVFDKLITQLIHTPAVQRLRCIRLSNIDSRNSPGIANISRFDHALGSAILACKTAYFQKLNESEKIALTAAALLHDSAISPFGHLIEEAFEYVEEGTAHEDRWSIIFDNAEDSEIGGIEVQMFFGRASGIQTWANNCFGRDSKEFLSLILESFSGGGKFGPIVASAIDVDNLDNLARCAYHIGIMSPSNLGVEIAQMFVGVNPSGLVVLKAEAISKIHEWLDLRRRVYERFMLSPIDFVGKAMVLQSTVRAIELGLLSVKDWKLVDDEFVDRLIRAREREVSDPIKRWMVGDYWTLSDLHWFEGRRPSFAFLRDLGKRLSRELNRNCFVYAIKDKRHRMIGFMCEDGGLHEAGYPSEKFVIGVSSSVRREFVKGENAILRDLLIDSGIGEYVGIAKLGAIEADNALPLLF